MRHNKISITLSPAAYVFLALVVVILPLKFLFTWLVCIVVHEASHIIMVFLCKGKVESIRFSLIGAQITANDLTVKKEISCILAGPTGSFLLLALLRFCPLIAFGGFVQGIFNLLPLMNLDGGRVLHGILSLRMDSSRVQKICMRFDRVTRITLCLIGLLIAWKLSWGALAIFAFIFALRGKKIKYPCKRRIQQVQYR